MPHKRYQRGSRAHQDLFGNELPEAKTGMKGRNPELIEKRNRRLLHRYYYYAQILKMRYDIMLLELEDDFEISTDTIPRIVDEYMTEMQRLKNERPGVEDLRKKYPKMVWQ